METLTQDVRYALRSWAKSPGFSALIVLTLALGIGANAAVFSVIDGVLLRPLGYVEPERLVVFRTELPQQGIASPIFSGPEMLDLQAGTSFLESLGGIWARPAALTDDRSEPEEISMGFVSAGFLPTLGVHPLLGRFMTSEEDVDNAPDVIVLSHGLWQRRYGSEPDIVGTRIEMDGRPHTVVGVMPESFAMWMPKDAGITEGLQAWVPWGGGYRELSRRFRVFTVVGRLAEGATIGEARAELDAVASRWVDEYPEDYERSGLRLHVEALRQDVTAPVRPALVVLWMTVAFVLLIACANVTNLLLVRATGMEQEIVVRRALGASRHRVLRQIVTESALLAATGGLLGVVLAYWGLGALAWLRPGELPRLDAVALDGRVLGFALLATIAVGAAIGLVSGFHLARGEPGMTLRDRSMGDGSRHRLRNLLVVSEIALSLVLLVGAGLLVRSFVSLSRSELGYETKDVTTLKLSLIDSAYPYTNPRKIAGFYRSLLERLDETSGVTVAGASTQLPLDGVTGQAPYSYETPDGIVEWDTVAASYRTVTPGFLEALRVPLLSGRLFDWNDDLDHPNVVVVDEKLAKRAWPNEPAVGKRLRAIVFVEGSFTPTWCDVIGVVAHVRNHPGVEGQEQLFLPHAQSPQRTMSFAIRSQLSADEIFASARRHVRALEPTQPVHSLMPMGDYRALAVAENRFTMLSLGAFAAAALVLAVLGVYGVIAFAVGRREREFGIRLALGATPSRILNSILRDGLGLVLPGLAVGVGAAFAFTRALKGLLYGISAADPFVFVSVALILMGAALAASYVPARRAASADPATVLRSE